MPVLVTTNTGGRRMQVEQTKLEGVVILSPPRFGDTRGFFEECWSKDAMARAGLSFDFVQDNHSFSTHAGTVRGLHYQSAPKAQDKLVRCGRGALFDVAVDVRAHSPTYGQWVGVTLSFENGKQLLVPQGFLHGFMTLTPECEILYKCTAPYAPGLEGAVAWDDPDLGIAWQDVGAAIVSDKDRSAQSFAQFQTPFHREGHI